MKQQIRLLLVEDETVLAGVVKETLEMKGFEVIYAADGQEGWQLYRQHQPDVCVIDVMMPRKDGLTLVQEIRATDTHTPLIFLTAKSEVQDVLKGFHAGADDYIKKPFSMEELILRIHALLKRTLAPAAPAASQGQLRLGNYLFDYPRQELHYGGETRRLSQREADLLKMLADNVNNITSRKDMLLSIWGDDSFFNARNMDVYITRMRKYLQQDENIQIVNVRGRGFKLLV
ncbi:response regulator transcription factor [Chitinophaga sp. G-6-1-13]|uniref:Response regulator transcription factor n=1 Tax=Chitinophaga fulva TaxID=2728842 RepID=A0A848GXC7_9BACT|nr:response regulator transcription factor [Chitinophaga fulva]NML42081.1 response regulator transcription factor [Chitinophaga fulva]